MSCRAALLLLASLLPLTAAADTTLSRQPRPIFSPTLSAGWAFALGEGSEQIPVSAGVAFYPELGPSFLAPRLGLLLELGIHRAEEGRSTHLSFTPTLQAGLALLIPGGRDKVRFARALLPLLHVYTILGVRLPGERDGVELPTAIRVGLGLSSPMLSLLSLALARASLGVPNLVELSAEIEPSTQNTRWLFKVGLGL